MDPAILVLNLGFLLPVTLLPFVTQLMGARRDEWAVVVVFAGTNLFGAFFLRQMWRRVATLPEIHKGPQTAILARRIAFGLRVYVAMMGVGVLVALIDVRAGIFCFVLTPIAQFYNFVRDPLRSRERPTSDDVTPVD